MNINTPTYNEPSAPWWAEVNNWCEGKTIDLSKIQEFESNPDRRVAQLCQLLKRLVQSPEKTIQENDSLTRWLLEKRNQRIVEKSFRPLNKNL